MQGRLRRPAAPIPTSAYAVLAALGVSAAVLGQTFAEASPANTRDKPPATGLSFPANPTAIDFFRAHVFEEPLVPVGGQPSPAENAALAAALEGYAQRSGPDDFSSLTGFLKSRPTSPWCASLLTDLGLEYYNTAHYSLALNAWSHAWTLGKDATNLEARAIAQRAFGELVYMDARLGRMNEIDALLKSINGQVMMAPAAERVVDAREALWTMRNRPEIAFRCGPLALRSIELALHRGGSSDAQILKSASTQKGCSLNQVAELSRKVGLDYQMAFREKGGDFIVPSVVHWKVGHYAAIVRKEGNLYQLQDPTFGSETWATSQALEAETTGYFLVPPAPLPAHWRGVGEQEGATVWGKGMTSGNDDRNTTQNDLETSDVSCLGMAVPAIHLMAVNQNLNDEPLGYNPPVGPPVRLFVRYNQRDSFQPANFNYSNFSHQWTSDWISYITDNPSNLLADVNLYAPGGGERTFTGFTANTQRFAYQQYDQTLLSRTTPDSYELLSGDGSKLVFSQPDGSIGTSRKVFLTRIVDPQGNAVTLTYDEYLRLVALTDAIGQVTTLSYTLTNFYDTNGIGLVGDMYKVTKITDPFGRLAALNYVPVQIAETYIYANGVLVETDPVYAWGLGSITDVMGMTSQFGYGQSGIVSQTGSGGFLQVNFSLFVKSLVTPYGTHSFYSGDNGNTRILEITYPDGSKERVEYNQTNNLPLSDPTPSVPTGMSTHNDFLKFRTTFYWDRIACALGYGDYSQARRYHWLHTENLATTAGALESMKPPLGGRIWFDYASQGDSIVISPSTRPTHVGRVLDDGSTQLYTFGYNAFGHLTNSQFH